MFCNKHLLFYTSTRATFNVTVRSGANLSRSRDKNDDNETPRKRILLFFSFFLFKRYRSFQPDTLFVARSNMEQTVFATGHRPVRNFPIDRSITMQVWIAAGHARFTGSILVHDIAIIEFSSFRNLDDEVTRSGVTAFWSDLGKLAPSNCIETLTRMWDRELLLCIYLLRCTKKKNTTTGILVQRKHDSNFSKWSSWNNF